MSFSRLIILSLCLLLFIAPVSLTAQEQQPEANVTIHVVQRGENLFRIAMRYNVTVDELARLNGILNSGNIQVGQRLLVPTSGNPGAAPLPQTHIVQPGENLTSIAQIYNLTPADLTTLNVIADTGEVYVGQILTISVSAPPPAELIPPAENAGDGAQSIVSAGISPTIHIVQRGETLFQIATRYGTTMNALSEANGITDPTLIYAGQQLIIANAEVPQLTVDLPAPITSMTVTPQVLVEGQTVRFQVTTSSPVNISGTFLGRILNAMPENNNTTHTILQGIPLFTQAGIYPLELLLTDKTTSVQTSFTANLQVVTGQYGSEAISLVAGLDNLLDPATEDAELNLLQAIMNVATEPRYFTGLMGLPAAATIISPFGTRRSYNGSEYNRFHAGTDFAGAPGTPILATAAGRVVMADTLNVRGMATVIDHGWGVYTGYWHQSQQYVQVGDFVESGQTIGTIGSTGRVTGAHLHWELWVGGVPVDPMQWVRQSFN